MPDSKSPVSDGNRDPRPDVAHFIKGKPDALREAVREGKTLTALCGHTWIPTLLEPEDWPVCQRCVRAAIRKVGPCLVWDGA